MPKESKPAAGVKAGKAGKADKPYRTARGVSHGMAERPQLAFDTPALSPTVDPELARAAGFEKPENDADYISSMGVKASADALANLIKDGRPEINNALWVPHRPERPAKSEGGKKFKLVSPFQPSGDQPTAIEELVKGVKDTSARNAPR